MKQATLAKWLKGVIIGMAVAGLALFAYLEPSFLKDVFQEEFRSWYWPWMIITWVAAVPCYLVLILGWQVSSNIGKDRSFCKENANLLKVISALALVDTGFLFVANVVMFALSMNHPGILLASLFVVLIGIVFSVAAAALSHLVLKAATLQEQSDLTI